jgi:trigger factor
MPAESGRPGAHKGGKLAVKVTKESITPTEVTLSIAMDSEDEDPFIDRSYRRTVSRIQIPGFRRGKAPRSIVESYVGRTALLHEALEFMIPETLDKALKDEDLQAFAEPQIELLEMEPVSFKAVVPLEPLVDLGDYRSIQVQREPVEVTDTQVDEVIQRLRRESAPWEPVERPAQFDDLLSLDVKGTIEGEEVVNDQGVDYIPQENNVLPFPGFSTYLTGMTEGQEKEFTLTIPEDYPRPQYAGKECQFQVKVLSIKEKQLPELDDEFAKGVGEGYDSLEALRNHIKERLTEEAEAAATQELEEKSLEELLNKASIQASQMLYQRELEMIQQERDRTLRNQRLDMDTYLSFIGKTEEEFQEEMRPRAEERLTRYLVLRKLAQEEGIEISPEEIQEEVDSLVLSAGEAAAPQLRRVLSSENARENLRVSLLNRKVIKCLAEIVQGPKEDTGVASVSTPQQAEGAEEPTTPETMEPSETADPKGTTEGAESHAEQPH